MLLDNPYSVVSARTVGNEGGYVYLTCVASAAQRAAGWGNSVGAQFGGPNSEGAGAAWFGTASGAPTTTEGLRGRHAAGSQVERGERPDGSLGLVRLLGPGDEIGGYRIESVVGRGGMGLVYRARQRRPERIVAIKVISPDAAADPGFRKRFERESAAAARAQGGQRSAELVGLAEQLVEVGLDLLA